METGSERLWRLEFRNGKASRNRVVVPPMASETATKEGLVTPRTLDHYRNLSEAHAGILFVEYTFAHASGRSEEFQLGLSSDAHIEGVSKIARIIRESGALAGIQLSHGGGKSERSLTGGSLMSPSGVPVPVKDTEMEIPDAMTRDEIQLWKDPFVAAAGRAVVAGFDLVELHAAHGYGLNQWLSPLTNKRGDDYGQDLPGRMKLLSEVVREIRAQYPSLLISVRIPGQDFISGGLTGEDGIEIAQQLERDGVDLIHVSSGIGGWRRPAFRVGEGYLVPDASRIQARVNVPVIGVGGIESGPFIDRLIRENQISMAAVGRAILKNPLQWGLKNLSIRETVTSHLSA